MWKGWARPGKGAFERGRLSWQAWAALAACAAAVTMAVCVVRVPGDGEAARAPNLPEAEGQQAQAAETTTAAGPEEAPSTLSPVRASGSYREAGFEPSAVFPRGAPEWLDYFPDKLGWPWWPFDWLPPSDSLLADAASQAPTPLFTQSFVAVANSAIAPKWLRGSFDDAKYLEHGEGAYRARTAHLCKVYEREGIHVVLKGFAGKIVVIMAPPPVAFSREEQAVLNNAASLPGDLSDEQYPYKDAKGGSPAAIESLFACIVDEVLTAVAQPLSEKLWEHRIKSVSMIYGGPRLSYLTKGPISDPGLGVPDEASIQHEVSLWTNGRVLALTVYSEVPDNRTKLSRQLQPTVEIATEGPLPGHITRVTTKNEWTDADGRLVPTQVQATHQYFYLLRERDTGHKALVELGHKSEQLEMAAWFAVADIQARIAFDQRYDHHWTPGGVRQAESRAKGLEWLKGRRDGCFAALERLRETPCPEALKGVRHNVLEALAETEPTWNIAWAQWEEALTQPEEAEVDYDAVVAAVKEKLREAGLRCPPAPGGPHPSDALKEGQEAVGIWVHEWW